MSGSSAKPPLVSAALMSLSRLCPSNEGVTDTERSWVDFFFLFILLLLKCPRRSPGAAAAPSPCRRLAAGWTSPACPPVAAARPRAEGSGAVLAQERPQGRPRPRSRSARPGSARDSAVPPPSAVNSSWTAEEETTGLGFSSVHKNALLSLLNACVSHPKQNPSLLAKLCWSSRCGRGARPKGGLELDPPHGSSPGQPVAGGRWW